jgi:phosphoribosylaminoimidazole-succinocarboxamide synthase
MAKQLEMMYEGKAKQVFATDDPTLAVIHYKDDATAFNGLKKGTIVGKGVVNNLVSNHLFKMLEANGVKTHLVEQLNERDSVVRRVSIVPIEVIVRNIAAGSLSKRLGLPEGTKLKTTVLEYCYKNDDLGDPMVNNYHILAAGFATQEEIDKISSMALKVNELMLEFFKSIGVDLIDFKIEFGKTSDGEIVLADEVSPDTCRLWDATTNEKLDKDRFRRDLGKVREAYEEILARLQKIVE